MIFCVAGDSHGALHRLYADLLAFEQSLGVTFPWVLHVGDFGIWPDKARVDKATWKHDGPGDFPLWWAQQRPVPRKTLFIKGNHEDFVWLDSQPTPEVHLGLFYLRNGTRFELSDGTSTLSVVGVGGCYGPSDFNRPSAQLQGYTKRHYTRDEIDAAMAGGHADIVLLHDAPAGVPFGRKLRSGVTESCSIGLDELLAAVRPRVCFFGHHHARFDAAVAGVQCLGLNKVGRPGNLVAIEMLPGEVAWRILGEWPDEG